MFKQYKLPAVVKSIGGIALEVVFFWQLVCTLTSDAELYC
jgi:hypothetical protein